MKDKLQDFAKSFGKVLLVYGVCPDCKGKTYYWKHQKEEGEEIRPVCPTCGYSAVLEKNQREVAKRVGLLNRQEAISKMKRTSIVTDDKGWKYSFDNYNIYNQENREAKEKALEWAEAILNGNKLHAIMTGSPGVGKTHLAFSIAQKVLVDSDYKKSVAVVSYRELLEQLKIGLNDPEAYKFMQMSIISDLKTVDLVIVDDLGAELGKLEEPSKPTNYNLDTLTSLTEARLHKATIYTSNLNSNQILTLYGERIYSRIVNGAISDNGMNAFRFKNTSDKRREF